jgi:nucleotide-binding universal stress UspA family protein
VAVGLAQACGAELRLLMVVPTLNTLVRERLATARLLPGATSALLDLTEQDAESYLQQQIDQLAERVTGVVAVVRRGDPAQVIVREARQAQADLIVLGTHGKRHLDAFWSGSTTPKVSAPAPAPLLLVPVHDGTAGVF